MSTPLPPDEAAGLIAAQRACDSDAAAAVLRQVWLIERATRDLVRGGAFTLAGRFLLKLPPAIGVAEAAGVLAPSLAAALRRRADRLADELDRASRADLDRRAAAILAAGASA